MDFSKTINLYILFFLIVLLSILAFWYPLLNNDGGFYLANARHLYDGKKYFIDIGIAYNPLSIVVLGIPFLLFEQPDPRWSLGINFAIILGCSFLLYKILATFSSNRNRNLFFCFYYCIATFVLDGTAIMLEPLSVFFLLVSLLLYLSSSNQNNYIRLFFSGIFISLSFLSKQYGLFLLIPFGIDFLFKKDKIIVKGLILSSAFCIPILIFVVYLMQNGLDFVTSIKSIFGKGVTLDVGNGTGMSFTWFTYSLGFILFFLCNAYLIVVLVALKQNFKKIINEHSLFLLIFLSSFLVVLTASYAHYFQYILPFSIVLLARVLQYFSPKMLKSLTITFLFSIILMLSISIYSFSKKENKWKTQNADQTTLLENIPAYSKVYFEGPSPSYYYLCKYNSINLSKIGYSFPGYFYPKSIVANLEIGSYVIILNDVFYNYEKALNDAFSQKTIQLDGVKYRVIQRLK